MQCLFGEGWCGTRTDDAHIQSAAWSVSNWSLRQRPVEIRKSLILDAGAAALVRAEDFFYQPAKDRGTRLDRVAHVFLDELMKATGSLAAAVTQVGARPLAISAGADFFLS